MKLVVASGTHDRVDALCIYGGVQIRELIESLENVPSPSSDENLNEYEKIIAKLDNHFIPMVNPDCARNKLEKMCQNEGESVAQYHVRLRLQVTKCSFAHPDDVILSKLLQTMRDKKLRREAMVKRYTLRQLLEYTANKEDIDRQAQHMEQTSPSAPPARKQVNRVHQKKHQKLKDKLNLNQYLMTRRAICVNFVGWTTKDPDHRAQLLGKLVVLARRKVVSPECAKVRRTQRIHSTVSNLQPSMFGRRNKRNHQTLILHFICISKQTSHYNQPRHGSDSH